MYSSITDNELDDLVTELVAGNDRLGPESVRASLHARGVRVQRRRVRESMLRTNPGGAALRSLLQRPERRSYSVQGPNSLWHIDGNHKLIRYVLFLNAVILRYFALATFNVIAYINIHNVFLGGG